MYKQFYKFANIEDIPELKDMDSFLRYFSGYTFKNGMYRVHKNEEIEKWTKIVCEAFPAYNGKIKVFGFDWLGRQFGLSKERGTVLLFEPGTGDVFDIPANFADFHNVEIAEYSEDSLASEFFEEWYESENKIVLLHSQCAGYKVPLFLNGDDDISNLEISDMEVYWGIMGQMIP